MTTSACGHFDFQANANYSRLVRIVYSKAAFREHLQHLFVAAQNVRSKFLDPSHARDPRQMLQQQCSDPVALVFVEHGKCDLSARRTFTPDIPPDANEALAGAVPERRSQSHVIDEIQFGKPVKIIIVLVIA